MKAHEAPFVACDASLAECELCGASSVGAAQRRRSRGGLRYSARALVRAASRRLDVRHRAGSRQGRFVSRDLVRVADQRLDAVVELRDVGGFPRPVGSTGSALACTAASALGVSVHPPSPSLDDDHDCVRLDVSAGTEAAASGDALVQDFVAQVGARGWRLPTTELFVSVTVRSVARRFDAKFWVDSADAGFDGQPVSAWTSKAAPQDAAKVAYARRLGVWGEAWRGLLLSGVAGSLPGQP